MCELYLNGFQDVLDVDSQWETNTNEIQANSIGESKQNTGTPIVLSECLKRIKGLSSRLGPLLQVGTLKGNARAEKMPCHFVFPEDRPKIWKNEDVCHECNGYRNNSP